LCLASMDVLKTGGVADTFDKLKEQGLIHACGITAAGDTLACLEVINSGRFDAAQVYYNVINPSAAWRRVPPDWRGGQDFCGLLAACFHQNMGVLNIRPLAGGLLGSAQRPERLVVITTEPHVGKREQSAPPPPAPLGDDYGTPAQTALRFVLGNRDISSRVVGFTSIAQLSEAVEAVAKGPLPTPAISKLDQLWANAFSNG